MIRWPLLLAEMYKAELHPWLYQTILNREGNHIQANFQPIPLPEPGQELTSNMVEATVMDEKVKDNEEPPLPK